MKSPAAYAKSLFDFLSESTHVNSIHSLHQAIKQEIKLMHPLEFKRFEAKLRGQHDTQSVKEYLLYSDQLKSYKMVGRFESHFTVPEYTSKKNYYPLKYWIKNDVIVKRLDALIVYAAKENIYNRAALVGEKGSGKTLTINCWLAERHKTLDKQKIIWLYADASNLYELWRLQNADSNKRPSIRDLFRLDLVYVIAKYRDESPFIKEIYQSIKFQEIKFSEFKRSGLDTFPEHFVSDAIDKLRDNIFKHETNWKHKPKTEANYHLFLLREAQKKRRGGTGQSKNGTGYRRRYIIFLLKMVIVF